MRREDLPADRLSAAQIRAQALSAHEKRAAPLVAARAKAKAKHQAAVAAELAARKAFNAAEAALGAESHRRDTEEGVTAAHLGELRPAFATAALERLSRAIAELRQSPGLRFAPGRFICPRPEGAGGEIAARIDALRSAHDQIAALVLEPLADDELERQVGAALASVSLLTQESIR